MRPNLFLVYGLFFASLVILGSLSLTFYQRYSVYTQYADAVEQTYETIAELNRLSTFLKDAETGQRGFLLSNDSSFLHSYIDGVANIKATFATVQKLTGDNINQQERLKKLNILLQDKINSMEHTRFMFLFNHKEYMANFRIEKEKMNECHEIISKMEQEELQLLGMRQESKEIYQSSTPQFLKALVAFSAFTFLGSFTLIIREFRRRVRYQKELEQKIAELAQSHLELEQIAYIASHDLQEPLRKIRMFSDLIVQKKPTVNELDKHVQKITNATERMQQLINDLLRFSRHSVGRGDFVETDLNAVMREAMKELELKIQQVQARITIDELPSTIVIPTLIQQVFHNLIANAIKFSKKGVAPEVHIYARHGTAPAFHDNPREGMYYNIYVKDNGIGFETKYLNDIFIPFKRLHSYHEIEGSGIGLSICKKIMEQHNGFITATSVLNDGATFIIGIPEKQVSI